MTETTTEKPREDSIPLPVAGATITGFAMLYVTTGQFRSANPAQFLGLPVLGTLLLLTYATHWRLPSSRWYGYALRGVLFGAIVLIVGMPREDTSFWYFKDEYTILGGYLLAAEMVVQAWRWRDWSQPPEAVGVAILLSALIVAAASNTYRHWQVGYFAPVYAVLLILSLRRIGIPAKTPRRATGLLVFRALLVLTALALAYAGVDSVNRYDRIIRRALKLLNRPQMHAELGLSDTPHLGSVFNPHPSLERVLIIDGPLSDPHLRAMAFDRYQGSGWRPMMSERTFVPIDDAGLGSSKSGARATVTELGGLPGLLVAPLDSAGIVTDAEIDRDDQGVLQTHNLTQNLGYQIIAPPRTANQGPLCIALGDQQRSMMLMIPPEIDPRVCQFAREIAGSGSPMTRLSRLEQELRDHHAYSLVFVPTGEPISDFVLNRRAAHCEYFGSAMVIMARSAGIPARFVTGYYAHELEGNQTVVRGRDAHAWAECWIDGTGWVTIDATPSSGTPDALYPRPSGWRLWWDWVSDLPRRIKQTLSQIGRGSVLLLAGAVVAIALLAALYRHLRDRRKQTITKWRQYAGPSADLAAAARRFERAVQRHGLILLPHRTWRESLAAAPAPFQEFISEYDILRFGAADDPHRLSELLDRIEQEPRISNP